MIGDDFLLAWGVESLPSGVVRYVLYIHTYFLSLFSCLLG